MLQLKDSCRRAQFVTPLDDRATGSFQNRGAKSDSLLAQGISQCYMSGIPSGDTEKAYLLSRQKIINLYQSSYDSIESSALLFHFLLGNPES